MDLYKDLYTELEEAYQENKAGYEMLVKSYEDGIEDVDTRIFVAHCLELAEVRVKAFRKMRNRAKWLLDNHGGLK